MRVEPTAQLRRAFAGMVSENEVVVQRICTRILGDEALGADASQETFLRLWRGLLLGRAPESPGGWLRRVAARCALDHLRRKRGRESPLADSEPAAPAAGAAGPLSLAAAAELRERYELALESLPEQQRIVFLLRHEGGMPLAEIARELDLALATAKTHLARACLKLQAQLTAYNKEPDS